MTDHKFVSLHDLLHILILIERMPNAREQPLPDDLEGNYDYWFDGGAMRVVTGYNVFDFKDGSRATMHEIPFFDIGIEFSNGARIRIRQQGEKRQDMR
jgi:hypothetical protein